MGWDDMGRDHGFLYAISSPLAQSSTLAPWRRWAERPEKAHYEIVSCEKSYYVVLDPTSRQQGVCAATTVVDRSSHLIPGYGCAAKLSRAAGGLLQVQNPTETLQPIAL